MEMLVRKDVGLWRCWSIRMLDYRNVVYKDVGL